MNLPEATRKRPRCPQCLRALSGCICHLAVPLSTKTSVTIIQHPSEEQRWKGTGRLLHLCLPHSELVVTEQISKSLLKPNKQAVLLYPAYADEPQIDVGKLDAQAIQLIILDGTWRKSRKLLAINPSLAKLPRLRLPQPLPPSRYSIRKAEKSSQLATIEAAGLALSLLEPDLLDKRRNQEDSAADHLNSVFEKFVTYLQQQEARFKGNTLE